ncbi:MAG TPA: MBL fold metallo-hydrolase [Bacteroidales bacterium]|nr:MBL fold metallo-hydrolase [Bacteroidales bacterium]
MIVHVLKPNRNVYSSNVYLLRGSDNSIGDVNTLIDTGTDPEIIKKIEQINTGVGKKTIAQILMTHNHFDHTGCIKCLKEKWNPKLLAYSKNINPNRVLRNNEVLKVADTWCQVLHVPEHSSDSLVFYFPEEKMLFSGDTPVSVLSDDVSFNETYLKRMEEMSKFNIETIYPGHGSIIENGKSVLEKSVNTLHRQINRLQY